MARDLTLLAVAGAAGTLARYSLQGYVQRLCGSTFPWGTLVVNLVGCLLFGIVWMLAEGRLVISVHTRLLVLTGFMGSFTTFSTFAFETGAFLRDSQWTMALGNLLLQNVLGLVAVFLGFAIGRSL